MKPTEGLSDAQQDAVIRDRDLAMELLEAQPTNPRIAKLLHSVLAREPGFTGTYLLLGIHHYARKEYDKARQPLHQLIGMQNDYLGSALAVLRDVEYDAENFDEAVRLAEQVMHVQPEPGWLDVMALGAATAFTGDRESGWDLMDEAVAYAARSTPEEHTQALSKRALYFLSTGAPPLRFLPAAEEAIAASPTDSKLSLALAYAYLYDYRAEDARDLLLRVLREDPTDVVAQGGMIAVRGFLDPIERGDATMDDFRSVGFGETAWRLMHEQIYDLDIPHAVAALGMVQPRALTRVLRGALRRKKLETTEGNSLLLAWHDGQDPGTGDAWGLAQPVRLLSNTEIEKLEAEIEQDPGAWPGWSAEEGFVLVATDDAGAYFIEGYAGRLYRREAGEPDREIAPSLADWLWDRVVGFGGRDPRPGSVGRR